jgi:hypothetical protein
MTASAAKSSQTAGFLAVCEHEGQGAFGGYLILNTAGRPLEFHCTAPVRPSRSQEILYGAALRPYLYGEQIGQALLERAKTQPLVVFTDQDAVLTVREFSDLPVAYVLPEDNSVVGVPSGEAAVQYRIDEAASQPPAPFSLRLHRFSVGLHRLAVLHDHEADAQSIAERWQPFASEFDLREPFARIREAIEEARRNAAR